MKNHHPLIALLLLYMMVAVSYSLLIPLGEAPDEPAHVAYAQFIARYGRLPTTLAEREAAQYKSAWPPLYHLLIAGPFFLVGDSPPTRLKAVGDTPRRLIPTNGQTIASFIHTADEAWPWQGLPRAWYMARFISLGLSVSSIVISYAIAYQLTQRPTIALLTATFQAFLPQFLFLSSVVSDDNLLIFWAGVIFLTLIYYGKKSQSPLHWLVYFFLGGLLGLALVTKYNALPLWLIVAGFLMSDLATRGGVSGRSFFSLLVSRLVAWLAGFLITGGWWFGFIWWHFNRGDQLGWLAGSWAALTAGTADASLRELSTGLTIHLPPLPTWGEWWQLLFYSFWGLFGGGSTIELPVWLYGLFAIATLWSLGRLIAGRLDIPDRLTYWFLLTPLLFLPLPLCRFLLSGRLVETAQGRHLFPALPAIALLFALASYELYGGVKRLLVQQGQNGGFVVPISMGLGSLKRSLRTGRFMFVRLLVYLLPLLYLGVALYALWRIQASYPPAIPLRTTAAAAIVDPSLNLDLTDTITLLGYELEPIQAGYLPVTLVWQATDIPPHDYWLKLQLTNPQGESIGSWLGHPLGGRYPTRAWDEGDILRHPIPVPLIPGQPMTVAQLDLQLYDSAGQSVAELVSLTSELTIPAIPQRIITPPELRADDLSPTDPFSYRSTLSYAWFGEQQSPYLSPSSGELIPPIYHEVDPTGQGHLAHFIVEADWPSGAYRLVNEAQIPIITSTVIIENRRRRFEVPPLPAGNEVWANFDHTLTLVGYELPQRRIESGGRLSLTLVWRAERVMGRSLTVFNHLLDATATRRGGADRLPQNYYTTLLWVPQEIVVDSYELPVDTTAPAGIYWLHVGLYPTDQPGQSLPLVDANSGQRLDQTSVRLGPIKVGDAPPGTTVRQATPDIMVNRTFGDQITLVGFDELVCPVTAEACHTRLRLYWQAEQPPAFDYNVFLHLLDEQKNLVAQVDSPPNDGVYPTSLWETGDIIPDERLLPMLPAGNYTIKLGLYRLTTGDRLPVDGSTEAAIDLIRIKID